MMISPNPAPSQPQAELPDVAAAPDALLSLLGGFGAELAALTGEAEAAAQPSPPDGEEAPPQDAAPAALAAHPLTLPWTPAQPAVPPAVTASPQAVAPLPSVSPVGNTALAAVEPRPAMPPAAPEATLPSQPWPVAGPGGEPPASAGDDAVVARQAVPASPAGVALAAAQPATPAAEWAPLPLPAAEPARWGETLRAALGERLQLQSAHGMDRALIRLDPPQLGELTIHIRHQGGALSVQLTASHGEVARQLQAVGESLRQDLSSRQYAQVDVEVRGGAQDMGGGTGRGRQGAPQAPLREPGRALADDGHGAPFTLQA